MPGFSVQVNYEAIYFLAEHYIHIIYEIDERCIIMHI